MLLALKLKLCTCLPSSQAGHRQALESGSFHDANLCNIQREGEKMKNIIARLTKMECFLFAFIAAILAVFFPTVSEAAPKEGLVLYLPFDEGAGDKVKDQSHNGNDGIVHNCKWVDGKFGSALEFDGTSNSFVEVPDSDTLASFQALTVSVWVKLTSFTQTWGRIIDKDGDPPSGTGFWMATRDGGAISAGFWNQPSVSVMIEFTETTIKKGEWTHIAFLWEKLGDFTVYFNGKKDGRKMTKDTPCKPTKGVPLLMGKPSEAVEAAVPIECYAGLIDEVAIYNYALTEGEIQQAIDGRLPGAAVDANDLLAVTWGAIKYEFFTYWSK